MPQKRKPTINEVAHLSKVGIGTVSRVLNNHPAVRPETRTRVQAAMEELGYRPNPTRGGWRAGAAIRYR